MAMIFSTPDTRRHSHRRDWMMAAAAICVAGPGVGWPQADLAKQLSNPVASLISVPLQFNYDKGIGPDDTACSVGSSRAAGLAWQSPWWGGV